jgi:hypothetical protein
MWPFCFLRHFDLNFEVTDTQVAASTTTFEAARPGTAKSTEAEAEAQQEAPKPAPTAKRSRRRGSVFVEAVEIDATWVAPSYAHSPDEVECLNGYVANTILLSPLDIQAKKSVIGAFQKRSYAAGEDIIKQVPTIALGPQAAHLFTSNNPDMCVMGRVRMGTTTTFSTLDTHTSGYPRTVNSPTDHRPKLRFSVWKE